MNDAATFLAYLKRRAIWREARRSVKELIRLASSRKTAREALSIYCGHNRAVRRGECGVAWLLNHSHRQVLALFEKHKGAQP